MPNESKTVTQLYMQLERASHSGIHEATVVSIDITFRRVNSAAAGGSEFRLIPWGSSGTHFYRNSGVQNYCYSNRNSCRGDQVTDQIHVVVFACFEEIFFQWY